VILFAFCTQTEIFAFAYRQFFHPGGTFSIVCPCNDSSFFCRDDILPLSSFALFLPSLRSADGFFSHLISDPTIFSSPILLEAVFLFSFLSYDEFRISSVGSPLSLFSEYRPLPRPSFSLTVPPWRSLEVDPRHSHPGSVPPPMFFHPLSLFCLSSITFVSLFYGLSPHLESRPPAWALFAPSFFFITCRPLTSRCVSPSFFDPDERSHLIGFPPFMLLLGPEDSPVRSLTCARSRSADFKFVPEVVVGSSFLSGKFGSCSSLFSSGCF